MWKSSFHGVLRYEVCLQQLPRIVAFCLSRITLCVGPRLHFWGFFSHEGGGSLTVFVVCPGKRRGDETN
jgi:hypothetical protein